MMIWTPANAAFKPDGTGGGGGDSFWESESADTVRLNGAPWAKAKFDSSAGRSILADNYFNTDLTSSIVLLSGGSNIRLVTAAGNEFGIDDASGGEMNMDLRFTPGAIGPVVQDTVVLGDFYRIEVASGVVTATLVP